MACFHLHSILHIWVPSNKCHTWVCRNLKPAQIGDSCIRRNDKTCFLELPHITISNQHFIPNGIYIWKLFPQIIYWFYFSVKNTWFTNSLFPIPVLKPSNNKLQPHLSYHQHYNHGINRNMVLQGPGQ